ncbi:Uncharacterized protein APZ42_034188 [Daphnia magna]|uniref:Chitin-binding type-2 domain-containing protein n=1 Tax=Daphnia magna TaxID=35525 RepID=A0A164KDC6_9CRUS|nr:Uncharacterized protein APZ42_034188 [Daphnia magna]
MLLFDRARGVCDYADLADTSSCILEPSPVVCPCRDEEPFSSSLDITKRLLPHPNDCRRFFFCETTIPRPLICEEHLAFDLETLSCIDKSQVQRWSRVQCQNAIFHPEHLENCNACRGKPRQYYV